MMYEVLLKKRAIESVARMEDFIRETDVVRIGMISEGEPYVVPVNFVHFDATVWFHCSLRGRKHGVFSSGARVCLEFDEQHGISREKADTYYTSVIAWGRASIVRDRETGRKVLRELVSKYLEEEREITDTMVDRTCIVSVKIEEMTGKENLV